MKRATTKSSASSTSVDLLAVAEDSGTSQRDLKALAERVAADPDPAGLLQRALDRRSDRAFTHLLFARLHLEHAVDAAVLAEGAGLLPDSTALAAACGRVRGDVGAALVTAVRGKRLGWDREPAALLIAELWSRRAAVPRPAGLLGEARIRARRHLTHEGEDALVALQGLIDDPDLAALIEPFAAADVKDAARILTSRLVDALLGEPLAAFPERPQRESRSKAPVRRAVAKVGRNDACPCGSGKKYKQCHEAIDRERLSESSDVEGMTFGELARDLERHLTPERMGALRGHELARLDPARVPESLRVDWIDHLAAWGEYDAAANGVETWIPADGALDEVLDDVLRLAAEHAARAGRDDLVRRLIAHRGSGEGLLLEAKLALCTSADERLALLEAAALTELDTTGVDLGFALIAGGFPALGIHVARSELALRGRDEHTDALYATVVETRDQLLVPPWDPIDDVLYTLDHGVAPEVDRELADTRQRMDRSDAALRATKEALESLKEELERREAEVEAPPVTRTATPVVQVVAAVNDGAVRELRERLEALKADLKDRHNERNALRRELEQSRAQVAELESAQTEDEAPEAEEDEDEGPLDVTVAAKVRIPVFPDDFHERLREVPEATGRAALMRLGEVCAGFGVAFREVRPLRGFDGIWRVKVGRSYRLLFRPLDHTLEVVDLLHRQDLEKRLFRLRRGGEG